MALNPNDLLMLSGTSVQRRLPTATGTKSVHAFGEGVTVKRVRKRKPVPKELKKIYRERHEAKFPEKARQRKRAAARRYYWRNVEKYRALARESAKSRGRKHQMSPEEWAERMKRQRERRKLLDQDPAYRAARLARNRAAKQRRAAAKQGAA